MPAGELINLAAARVERRPIELDHQCRDCGRYFPGLASLTDHYAFECGSPQQRHPSRRWR